jgi:hypothetical protein
MPLHLTTPALRADIATPFLAVDVTAAALRTDVHASARHRIISDLESNKREVGRSQQGSRGCLGIRRNLPFLRVYVQTAVLRVDIHASVRRMDVAAPVVRVDVHAAAAGVDVHAAAGGVQVAEAWGALVPRSVVLLETVGSPGGV